MSVKWIDSTTRLDDNLIEIPKSYKPGMKVPGLVFASKDMEESLFSDNALEQVANVATLPGIVDASFAMPDIHWGYGFPIGGVAAFDANDGVISPGGVGYDINCGVRLLSTALEAKDASRFMQKIVAKLFENIPSGVGSEGKLKISKQDFPKVLEQGAKWAVSEGFGLPEDIELIEDNGAMVGADHEAISKDAMSRGAPQLGTLGAGNHFLEVQEVVEIFDEEAAKVFNLFKGQLTVLIHTGSRGLGHQVATDYIEVMQKAAKKYGINLVDRQLACAPIGSIEGKQYFSAMAAAANYAWANRQVITHWVRQSLLDAIGISKSRLDAKLVYDVAHNIAKKETHNGKNLMVHRKGATRAFTAGMPGLPQQYINTGHPVLVPGDMGRYSFVMVGTDKGRKEVFASACHGAGRMLSRTKAFEKFTVSGLTKQLGESGVFFKAKSNDTLIEEAPGAYKDVELVVNVLHNAGIAKKIVKMKPLGVVKG
ncbi:MAG: RtcB family protein [Caldisericia bacterium]|nr:RtcB family protein [Caldisericia bacterium]